MPAKNNTPTPEPGLPKYANLCNQLEADVAQLTGLHNQQAELVGQQSSLAITRGRLSQSILDQEAPIENLSETLRELETERLVLEASLEALAPRVSKAEGELHARLPLAIRCFARLHGRVVTCVLDSAKESVTKLLAPGYTVPEEVINQIAIATPAFVEISQLKLPGLTHILTRDLEFTQPHWSSLVRPFTEAEKRAQRRETIESLISATNELVLAARRLIELASAWPERVPEFRCEPEVSEPPQSVAPLEWLQPLGGSDEEWCKEICKAGGKPYPPTDPAQIEILSRMLEARHAHPVSHGIISGEMIGATFQEESKR
jgi:hypothetical protein